MYIIMNKININPAVPRAYRLVCEVNRVGDNNSVI